MGTRHVPISGEVDIASAPDLQTKLYVLITGTDDDLVLDCSELTFIDSTGIGMFVRVQQALQVLDRGCTIENMNPQCRRPFDILGLAERFGITACDSA